MPTQRISGATWRVSQGGGVTRRIGPRGPWEVVTQAELRAIPIESAEGEWLHSCGVRRTGGVTVGETEREAKQVLLRLRPATTARLGAIALSRGLTRSEAVASLVEAATGVRKVVERGDLRAEVERLRAALAECGRAGCPSATRTTSARNGDENG